MQIAYFPLRSFVYLLLVAIPLVAQDASTPSRTQIPNSKLFGELPGNPRRINNFPTAAAVSPDGRFAVFLHSGYAAYTSSQKQSLTVLNLESDSVRDFPDDAMAHFALGNVFAGEGHRDEAINQFQAAHRLDPDDVAIKARLDSALAGVR